MPNWQISETAGSKGLTQMSFLFADKAAFIADIRSWDMSWSWEGPDIDFQDMFSGATTWQERYINCGHSSSSGHPACTGSYPAASDPDNGPPSSWIRKDNACDASSPPTNGAAGTCTDTLVSGSTCQPECDSGYTVSGTTSCTDRVLTAAKCTVTPSPPSSTSCSSSRATGGTITTVGEYTIHTFISDGTFEVTDSTLTVVDALVVGGGAGGTGGDITSSGGAGGGGGEVLSASNMIVSKRGYSVTVGYGGNGGTLLTAAIGGHSEFHGLIAAGGYTSSPYT